MIKLQHNDIDMMRIAIIDVAMRNGFGNESVEMLNTGLTDAQLLTRVHMFVALGIASSTERLVKFNDVFSYAKRGANKFFRTMRHRWELSDEMIALNMFKGKYSLACDYYIAPAVFETQLVSDKIISEWNEMMKRIRIHEKYSVKVIRVVNDLKHLSVKYNWITSLNA